MTVEPIGSQGLIEQASGRTHKWTATQVFISSGGFTNEHNGCRAFTLSRYGLRP
jgi:hypothetical protein